MGITSAIIAGVGLAASLATTGLALAKGGPDLPKVPPPVKPPAPPAIPPPPPLPPPPSETEAGAAVATERRKRQQRFGISNTLLTSPLGGSGSSGSATEGKTLLGG
jgi:hypothetical protein